MKSSIVILVIAIIFIGAFYFYTANDSNRMEEDLMQNGQEEAMTNENQMEENNSITQEEQKLTLTSSAFANNSKIPSKYTCDGEKINPPLEISGIDVKAKSLVLIVEDPDVPANVRADGMWNHWVKFNIPTTASIIDEGMDPGGITGMGTGGAQKYIGPCPPDREHRYFFKLYSLDDMLDLTSSATKEQVLEAMRGHILQQTELVGRYAR
jgi:hypothetical protein